MLRIILPFLVMFFSLPTLAGTVSYRIDSFGNVQGSAEEIRYYGGGTLGGQYWLLNGATNTVTYIGSGGAGPRSLIAPFSVSDITDLTWTGGNTAWVTTDGANYRIDSFGNSLESTANFRYYGGASTSGQYWRLDSNANTVTYNGGGGAGTRPLNAPFAVSDINDVTWTGGNSAWVTTDGMNYRIDAFGNIQQSTPNIRYYGGDSIGGLYWTLDDAANTVAFNGTGGGAQSLNAPFTVADISDVTWTGGNTAWVTVNTVPLPAAAWLFGSALLGLVAVSRRRHRLT